jgi:hypothetical protein
LWLLVLPFGPLIFLADEARKWIVRRRASASMDLQVA